MRRTLLLFALALAVLLLPASAQAAPRIVALTPFGANTLAKLGVRPVAVGQTLGGRDRLSPKLKGVPVLTLSHPNGPNLEQLASLDRVTKELHEAGRARRGGTARPVGRRRRERRVERPDQSCDPGMRGMAHGDAARVPAKRVRKFSLAAGQHHSQPGVEV